MEKICFVIMGYGKKTDPILGKTFDLDITYRSIIKPAVEKAGFKCVRGDEVLESGIIDKSMYALLVHADLVIADITTFNPNAIYELGIRHAAKPFSTIIMREKDGSIPFDIGHNKIFKYAHMGEDIGVSETQRSVNALYTLIIEVNRAREIDSPLFHHLKGVQPHSLPEGEYIQIIRELADKENSVFALVEKAKHEMKNNNFQEAAKCWKIASEKVENDSYFIQQLALCTYKNTNIEANIALTDALQIINRLEPDNRNTTDPETLGITGAIYKRLWQNNRKTIGYIDRAIEYYKRSFTINQDYYTGENYAFCMDQKATLISDPDEQTYLKYSAKATRKEIITIIDKLQQDPDFNLRSDLKWIYATLSNCYYATGDMTSFQLYKELFYNLMPDEWEIATYEEALTNLNYTNN